MSYQTANRLIFTPRYFFRRKALLSLFVFVIALLVRLNNIGYQNIWMDEDAQANESIGRFFDLSLVDKALSHLQPPIDYYLEAVGLSNFGFNETGARINSAFLGSCAAMVFFLFLTYAVFNPIAVLLGSVIFVFHPYLIIYSQEGRPVSCGVFFCALYLFALLSFLRSAKGRLFDIRLFFLLIVVQTGFLLSVGFQPLVFLATSFLALSPLSAFKKYRIRVLLSYLSGVVSFFLALPILFETIKRGSNYLDETSVLIMVEKVLGNIGGFSMESWLKMQRTLIGDWWPVLTIGLVLGLAGLAANRRKDGCFYFAVYLIVFSLIYPIVYDILFNSLISYKKMPRYYLTFIPVIISLVAILFKYSLMLMDNVRKSFLGKKSYAICIIVSAIFCFSFVNNLQSVHGAYSRKTKTEWKAAYDLFKKDDRNGSMAYMMNLIKIDAWNPGFYSQRFYYRREEPRPVILKKIDQLRRDIRSSKFRKENKNVYFVTTYGSRKIKSSFFENKKNIRHFAYNRLSVIKISGGGAILEDIIEALNALKENLKRTEDNYKVYELLFHMQMENKDRENAKKSLDALIEMDRRNKLNKLTTSLIKRLRT
jgi:hypothetical protein